MVKIVKKKKRFRMESLIYVVFFLSLLAFLFSVTVMRANNVVLAKRENEIKLNITKLKNDVANLELEVKQLDNRERILSIVEKEGLKVNQNSIVSVASNNSKSE